MKKFTKLWQLTMVLIFMSSFAFAQSVEQKVQLKEQFKPQTAAEEAAVEEMWKSGLDLNSLRANDKQTAEEIMTAVENQKAVEPAALNEVGEPSVKGQSQANSTVEINMGVVPTTSPMKPVVFKPSGKSPEAVLYSQMTPNPAGGGGASQNFGAANDIYDCFGADDFTVTGGPWSVTNVNFLGTYSAGGGPNSLWNIEFYADNAGLPGASIGSYPLTFTTENAGLFSCFLPTPMVLADGTYWISIQVDMAFGAGGQWYWSFLDPATPIVAEGLWQNPLDGFGSGQTTWGPMSNIFPGNHDYCFEFTDDPPPACIDPSNLWTLNYTATSATLGWNENGVATLWDIEYGPAGFVPGTGTTITGVTNPYNLTGLTTGTDYDWYVNADCGGGNLSTQIMSSFRLPDYFGTITPTTICQTDAAVSFLANGGRAWYTVNVDAANIHNFSTCNLDVAPLCGGTSTGDLDFTLYAADGLTQVWYVDGNSGCGWSATTYGSLQQDWVPPATGVYYLMVDSWDGTTPQTFDLAYIAAPIPCAPPINISTTNIAEATATFQWDEAGTSSTWNLVWGAPGFDPDLGPFAGTFTKNDPFGGNPRTYNVTGLTQGTPYEWYVQSDCGGGDLSVWVGPNAFTTIMPPQPSNELLYQIDVETITGTNRVLGAEFFAPTGSLWVTASTSSAAGGNDLFEIDPYTGTLLNTYPQITTSVWGMRDLANDGTFIYGGDGNGFYQIDPLTGVQVTLFTPTGIGTIRALAYDPVTAHFWTKSFAGDLYEFDATGTVFNTFTFPGDNPSTYGAAWDQSTSMLWLFASGLYSLETNEFVEVDPLTGLLTGTAVGLPDHPCPTGGIVGGGFMDFGNMYPGRDIFGGMTQGTPDAVYIMEAYDTGFPDQSGNNLPMCGDIGVPLAGNLTWDFGANTDTYDLWLGPAGAMVQVVTGAAAGGPSGSYAYAGLSGSTNYEWQVVEHNLADLGPTDGLIYSFATLITCPAPTTQAAANITQTSADLSWVETGAATLWDIEWGPAGFVQGTGTMITGVVANPYTLGGLTSSTAYDWYVRADCGGGDLSFWTGPHSFVTSCGTFAAPFFEGFEGGVLPPCWVQETADNFDWTVKTGSTSSSNTGPTSASEGSWYIYTETSGSSNGWVATLYSPEIDLTPLVAPYQITFDYHMWGAGMNPDGSITVDISTDAGATWTNFFTQVGDHGNLWNPFAYDLSAYTGLVMFKFTGTVSSTGTTYQNDFALDAINVDETPACPDPFGLSATNITATSADLTWTSTSGLSDLEWGPTGFAQGTGTMVTGAANPYPLGGLTPATGYDFYVMDDCGGGITSNWVGPVTFNTPPANDLCVDAELIDCATGSVFGTTVGATVDAPGTCGTSVTAPGVWYTFTATGNDWIDLSLCNTAITWDSKLSVYSGDCVTPICVVGNDDFCGLMSAVGFQASTGVDYYILVHGYSSNTGDFELTIACTPIFTISGTLSYANGALTPIDNSTVDLYDNTPALIATTTTDPFGFYGFSVFPGDYSLDAATTKPRGGTAVGDVNVVVNHILGSPLTGLPFMAADVTADAIVDVSDLNGLVNEILGVNPGWAAPDWLFEMPAFTVGSDVVVDFQGLCSGDPDGDFVPAYSCADPTGLGAVNIGGISADLTWTSNSGLSNLEWGPAGFVLGTGTTVTGVTSPYSLGGLALNTAYDFYVQDDCSPFALSGWAGPGTFTTLPTLYCPAGSNLCDEFIDGVELGTLSNLLTGCVGGYADYTALSTDLTQGALGVPLIITHGGGAYSGDDLGMWIDWNQDGDFADAGEQLVCGVDDGAGGTYLFDVPAGATLGSTMMRIRMKWSGSDCGSPCGSTSYGEVEDYTVNIVP